MLSLVSITSTRASIPGDSNLSMPGGLAFGTPVLTARGCDQSDFERVAEYIHRGCHVAMEIKEELPQWHTPKEFKAMLNEKMAAGHAAAMSLKADVQAFAMHFSLPII